MISFFGGIVKNKMYEKNPKTVNELKDYVVDAFKKIDEDQNFCRTVCHRVWAGVKNVAMFGGGHFEHLRD